MNKLASSKLKPKRDFQNGNKLASSKLKPKIDYQNGNKLASLKDAVTENGNLTQMIGLERLLLEGKSLTVTHLRRCCSSSDLKLFI